MDRQECVEVGLFCRSYDNGKLGIFWFTGRGFSVKGSLFGIFPPIERSDSLSRDRSSSSSSSSAADAGGRAVSLKIVGGTTILSRNKACEKLKKPPKEFSFEGFLDFRILNF
ncbi:hypothetical protein CH370_06120 [Leptospira kmetyi]|nr:hypothetical protein CH370_06120 [Leptospira kmetyi]